MHPSKKHRNIDSKEKKIAAAKASQTNKPTAKRYDDPNPKEGMVTDIASAVVRTICAIWRWISRQLCRLICWLKENHELILAMATVFLVVIAGLQWDALVKTDKNIAKQDETARLRDRAFLYFTDPGVRQWPPAPGSADRWAISIRIFNAGNVPARGVTIKHACPTTVGPQKISDPFQDAYWKPTPLPNVIGPKQDFAAQGCEFTTAQIEEAKAGKREIFVVMETQYTDGFELNIRRQTRMVRQLLPDTRVGYSLSFVGPHNCSDDDCPP